MSVMDLKDMMVNFNWEAFAKLATCEGNLSFPKNYGRSEISFALWVKLEKGVISPYM